MTAKLKPDWITTMTLRTANMLRNVSQGMIKSKGADWVLKVPWMSENGNQKEYAYGWDLEVNTAWRCPEGSTRKELAVEIVKPEGYSGLTPVTAKWSDGHEHAIVDMTCDEFTETVTPSGRLSKELWEGEHIVTRQQKGCIQIGVGKFEPPTIWIKLILAAR